MSASDMNLLLLKSSQFGVDMMSFLSRSLFTSGNDSIMLYVVFKFLMSLYTGDVSSSCDSISSKVFRILSQISLYRFSVMRESSIGIPSCSLICIALSNFSCTYGSFWILIFSSGVIPVTLVSMISFAFPTTHFEVVTVGAHPADSGFTLDPAGASPVTSDS
jgi:hypothetical protein